MTRYVLDVAEWQGSLRPADVKRAGFSVVNLKVSHGLGLKSVHSDITGWVKDARALGLGISTFHFMTAEGAGWAQAEHAHSRLAALGLLHGTAHQLDIECEPAPRLVDVKSYLQAMTKFLGRPIALYTGDWWWQPKGWNVAALTPYVWSAPNAGYLGPYPGDASPHWVAGWGGWPHLSVMQYAVEPLRFPDGKTGTIKVSKSAIRDERVWIALTGGPDMAWVNTPAALSLVDEFNKLSPKRDRASDGGIGDGEHSRSTSDHNPDETGETGSAGDSDNINEIHARDIDNTGPWPAGWTMEKFLQLILARCRSGTEKRVRYLIYNGRIWTRSNGWRQEKYSGKNPHDHHLHVSFMYGSGSGTSNPENDTSPWGLLAAVNEEDDDMATISQKDFDARMDEWWKSRMTPPAAGTVVSGLSPLGLLRRAPWNLPVAEGMTMFTVMSELTRMATAEAAEVPPSTREMVDAFKAALGAGQMSPEETATILVSLLGDRAPAVGRILQAGTKG